MAKQKNVVRTWDETDEWANRIFGKAPASRRVQVRNGLEKHGFASKAVFDSLFAKQSVAAMAVA